MVTFLQRTFTSLVHAHAGRTQVKARGLGKAVTFLFQKIANFTKPVFEAFRL
jgi:hypothetical protein